MWPFTQVRHTAVVYLINTTHQKMMIAPAITAFMAARLDW
jgi:hypothetical protein